VLLLGPLAAFPNSAPVTPIAPWPIPSPPLLIRPRMTLSLLVNDHSRQSVMARSAPLSVRLKT